MKSRKQCTSSPLSKIELEINNQKKSAKKSSRISLTSTCSADSITTTGRLLDKLKMTDNEWDYTDDSFDSPTKLIDTDTSTSSVFTQNSYNENGKIGDDGNTTLNNTSNNSIPASKFRYLKSVLGSTKKINSQKSAVNRALEMGKKINTVEQNASRIVQRSHIKSIHLDGLLQDSNASVSSFETVSDDEIDDGNIDELKKEEFYHGSSELEIIPNTPTKSSNDLTPVNSPRFTSQMTPQFSINSTPEKQKYFHHKHTLSTLSNGSHNLESIRDIVIESRNDLISPSSKLEKNSTHQHTKSDFNGYPANNLNLGVDSLMRSSSVPIQKSASCIKSPVPNKPLPMPTANISSPNQGSPSNLNIQTHSNNVFTSSIQYSRIHSPNLQKEHIIHNGSLYNQQQYHQQYYNNYPPQQHKPGLPVTKAQPLSQQHNYKGNNTSNQYATMRGKNSPVAQQFQTFGHHQQLQPHQSNSPIKYRNYNPQYQNQSPPVSKSPLQQQSYFTQQQLHLNGHYPKQYQHQYQHSMPNHHGNTYHNNSQRHGYHAQSPQMENVKLLPNTPFNSNIKYIERAISPSVPTGYPKNKYKQSGC